MGGLNLPMRGLKYGWRCTMNTEKHPRKSSSPKTEGGLAFSNDGASAPLALPSATPSKLLSRCVSF